MATKEGVHTTMRKLILILAVLSLLLVTACGSQPAAQQSSNEILIGGIGPLSPPGTPALGQELRDAMQLAVDDINAAGGINGKKLKLIYEDSAGAPEKGQAAVEKLITKDKVVAIAGEGHSSAALAEIEVAKKNNIPIVISEAWSDTITEKGYPNVFRVAPNNSMFAKKVVGFIQQFGYKRVAIMVEDTDFGIGNEKLLGQALKKLGIEYKSQVINREAKDFVPQLLELKQFKPDIILNLFTGVGSYLIVKQAKEQDIAPTPGCTMLMGGADAAYPEIWQTVGKAAQYVVWQSPYTPKAKFTDKTQTVMAAYTKKYNHTPTYATLHAYDSILVIADAIKRANSTKPEDIIKAMQTTKLVGTRGEISFPQEKGVDFQNWLADLLFLQYTEVNQKAEAAEIVYPVGLKTVDLIRK